MGNSVSLDHNSTQSLSKLNSSRPVVRTPNSRIVSIFVEDDIQFELDVADNKGEKTCGWLLQEVSNRYSQLIEKIRLDEDKATQIKAVQSIQKRKRRYIVALKTEDMREGVDCWLTQYERNLSVLKDGTRLVAHFSKINFETRVNLSQKRFITIDDFEQIRVIGRGGFSQVILARKKDTGRVYAIKILRKDKLLGAGHLKPVLTEREILQKLDDHPYVIKLHWAFQSTQNLYFVMDICTGGELFTHLIHQQRFTEEQARFYMSEVLLGFKHLHDKDIVFRDIKPENILIDLDGHVRIADFGLSKIIKQNERSNSICGSPEYLSPEMLNSGEGHDRRVDIYSLGVLLFEMLTGLPPFYDEDHQKMFDQIVNEDLNLKQTYLSSVVKDLLQNMLEKDPVMRYQTIDEIMHHPWFADVSWKAFMLKKVKSPIQPDINQCYFENIGADIDLTHDLTQPVSRQSVYHNQSRINYPRRQSYYLHSSVNLYTNIDEQTSFVRSSSQMRRFLEQSNINESNFDINSQNVLNSFALGSDNQLQRQPSPFALNVSRLIQKNPSTQLDSSYSPQRLQELVSQNNFPDFNYSSPPFADTQILRVLENQLKKKHDQMKQARQYKEKSLQQSSQGKSDNSQRPSCNQTIDESLVDHQRPNHMQAKRFFQYKQGAATLLRRHHSKQTSSGKGDSSSRIKSSKHSPGNFNKSSTLVTVAEEYSPEDVVIGHRVVKQENVRDQIDDQQLIDDIPVYQQTEDRMSEKPMFKSNSRHELQKIIKDIPGSHFSRSNPRRHSSDSSFRTVPDKNEDPPSLDGSSKSTIKFVCANSKERPDEIFLEPKGEDDLDAVTGKFCFSNAFIKDQQLESSSLEDEFFEFGHQQSFQHFGSTVTNTRKPIDSYVKKMLSQACISTTENLQGQQNEKLSYQRERDPFTEFQMAVSDEHHQDSPALTLRNNSVKPKSLSNARQSLECLKTNTLDKLTSSDKQSHFKMMGANLEKLKIKKIQTGSQPTVSEQSEETKTEKIFVHLSNFQSQSPTSYKIAAVEPVDISLAFEDSITPKPMKQVRAFDFQEPVPSNTMQIRIPQPIEPQVEQKLSTKGKSKKAVSRQKKNTPVLKVPNPVQASLKGSFKSQKVTAQQQKTSGYFSQDGEKPKNSHMKEMSPPPFQRFSDLGNRQSKKSIKSTLSKKQKPVKVSLSFNRWVSPTASKQTQKIGFKSPQQPSRFSLGLRKRASSESNLTNEISNEIAGSHVADESEVRRTSQISETKTIGPRKISEVVSIKTLLRNSMTSSPTHIKQKSFDANRVVRDKTPKMSASSTQLPQPLYMMPTSPFNKPQKTTQLAKKRPLTQKQRPTTADSKQAKHRTSKSSISTGTQKSTDVGPTKKKTSLQKNSPGPVLEHIKVKDFVLQAQHHSWQVKKGQPRKQNQAEKQKINTDLPLTTTTCQNMNTLTLAQQKSSETITTIQTPQKSADFIAFNSISKKQSQTRETDRSIIKQGSMTSVSPRKTGKVHHVTLSLTTKLPNERVIESRNDSSPSVILDRLKPAQSTTQKPSTVRRHTQKLLEIDRSIDNQSCQKLKTPQTNLQKVLNPYFSSSHKLMVPQESSSRGISPLFVQQSSPGKSCRQIQLRSPCKLVESFSYSNQLVERSDIQIRSQASQSCLNDRLSLLSRQVGKGTASQRSSQPQKSSHSPFLHQM